jgi:glycosyltransferase involved in cell wall biosynthesis
LYAARVRIAYVVSACLPSRETDTQQAMKTVDALAAEGAEVAVLLPESHSLRARGLLAFEAELRAFYGLRSRFRLVPVRGIEPDRRIEAHRPIHALRACLSVSPAETDAVYTRARSAALLCSWRGLPFVVETYRELGRRHPLLAALFVRLARNRCFLGVIAHSQLARSSLESAGFPASKLAAVYNGHDPEDMLPRLAREEARLRLGLDRSRPLVCYTGNLGARKGLRALLAVARLTPEVDYWLVGGADVEAAALESTARREGAANLRCLPWRPARELGPYLYAADVLVIPPSSAPLERFGRTVLPMKTFGYLAAGRAILAPDLPDVREVLVHGESGWLVPPDQPAQAAAGVRRLTCDPSLAARLGRAALERSAAFTWRARARRILGLIDAWKRSAE